MQRVSGITGAGPVFARVMRLAMRDVPRAPLVERSRLEHVRVCPLSGHRAGEACPGAYEEVFLAGTAPGAPCEMHQLAAGHRVLDVGPRFYAWAQRERLDVGFGEESRAEGGAAPGFITPRDGDEFLVEQGIPVESQTIPVRIQGRADTQLLVDGTVTPLDRWLRTRLQLTSGVHRLELWPARATAPASAVAIRVRGGAAPGR
jgi:penicillin-binding protein 1C